MVLEKQRALGGCHICFPKSCCDGKQALLVLSVNGLCKFDQDLTGRTTDNGVGKRSQAGLHLLDDIDSSTKETWLHKRGVYSSNMEGQRSHGVGSTDVFW